VADWAMSDADFERERKRVAAAVDRWFEPMGLKLWQKVQVSYWRQALTDLAGDPIDATADCQAQWQYLCAHIRFCLPRTVDNDDDQLDYIVRHEMTHALVREMRQQPFTDESLAHEERVVTNLAMVLGWVRDHFGAKS
jgi:hypothetical protein